MDPVSIHLQEIRRAVAVLTACTSLLFPCPEAALSNTPGPDVAARAARRPPAEAPHSPLRRPSKL